MFRGRLCKEILENMKLKQIGFKLKPPLLLHITTEELDKDREKKQWKEEEKNVHYNDNKAISRFISYDYMKECGKQQGDPVEWTK